MSVNNRNRGFSLLELIIVLVIIGVVVTAIVLSITDTRQDQLRLEARKLAARIALARDEAIITNQELGLEVKSDSYQFLTLVEERWQPLGEGNERQLTQQQLPETMEILLKVDGLFSQFQQQEDVSQLFKDYDESTDEDSETSQEKDRLRPQIYLMSSGEMNAFVLVIGYESEDPVYYQLTGTYDGSITLDGPIQDSMNYGLGQR